MPTVTDFNPQGNQDQFLSVVSITTRSRYVWTGYQSLLALGESLTQAQQNAYAQGNVPQSYGRLEMMNPLNKDPNVQENKRLNQVGAAKDMYTRVTPVHRRTQAGLDRAGGVPVQQYHTERAANAFARANQ